MEQKCIELIESYNEYIVRVNNGCLNIANKIHNDEMQEALQRILEFSEGMLWLVDATEALKQQNVDSNLQIEKVQVFLEEINSGLATQDYVLVADLFEYEIAPFFEENKTINFKD